MTITHGDFFRLLPMAVNGLPYNISGNLVSIDDQDRSIRIVLGDETSRKMAALTLPVIQISIEFKGYEDKQIDIILKRFDLAYQKGGG